MLDRRFRSQPNYHLPPSLKATVTQQTVPHSFFFDGEFPSQSRLHSSTSLTLRPLSLAGIIFPSLRDRLILLKDQYDLQTLLDDLLEGVEMHENDILMPSNWELSEGFLRKYW